MSVKMIKPGLWRIDATRKHDGRQVRARETFKGTRKQAEDRNAILSAELAEKATVKARSLKVCASFEEVLQHYCDRHDVGTSECLFDKLKRDLGKVPVSQLHGKFDTWMQILHREKSIRTKKPIAPATRNRYRAWTMTALNYAVKCGLIKENPIKFVDKEAERPRDRTLTEAEERKLLEAVGEHAEYLLPVITFALAIPCRLNELRLMRREWVDHFNQCVSIPGEFTKNDRPCVKPIPPGMKEYFRSIPAESDFVFFRKIGGKKRHPSIEYRNIGEIKKAWWKCTKAAGLTGLHFHDLRRVSYSNLILAGNDGHIVSAISGHRTDMSRVYLNISGMQAVKAVRFTDASVTRGVTFKGDSVTFSAINPDNSHTLQAASGK